MVAAVCYSFVYLLWNQLGWAADARRTEKWRSWNVFWEICLMIKVLLNYKMTFILAPFLPLLRRTSILSLTSSFHSGIAWRKEFSSPDLTTTVNIHEHKLSRPEKKKKTLSILNDDETKVKISRAIRNIPSINFLFPGFSHSRDACANV